MKINKWENPNKRGWHNIYVDGRYMGKYYYERTRTYWRDENNYRRSTISIAGHIEWDNYEKEGLEHMSTYHEAWQFVKYRAGHRRLLEMSV